MKYSSASGLQGPSEMVACGNPEIRQRSLGDKEFDLVSSLLQTEAARIEKSKHPNGREPHLAVRADFVSRLQTTGQEADALLCDIIAARAAMANLALERPRTNNGVYVGRLRVPYYGEPLQLPFPFYNKEVMSAEQRDGINRLLEEFWSAGYEFVHVSTNPYETLTAGEGRHLGGYKPCENATHALYAYTDLGAGFRGQEEYITGLVHAILGAPDPE